jgi:4-hydroxy-3-polyprenylbenzoate decarboxylase
VTRRIVVAVTGASGAPYAKRLLDYLAEHGERLSLEVHVVFTKFGRLVWTDEIGSDPRDLPFPSWQPNDMMAPFSSGSAGFDGMVVAPCSAGTLARIATGVSTDLVCRAGDVMLKERRKLVLVLRESPYSLIHLRNMTALVEAGAVVMPAAPSFYSAPQTLEGLLDTVTARILDQLGIPNELMRRWTGALVGHGEVR